MKRAYHDFNEMTEDMRPQDPHMDGTGLTFKTLEHGGLYPDQMPQCIRLIDAEGRSCIYSAVTHQGRVVASHGFGLETIKLVQTSPPGEFQKAS